VYKHLASCILLLVVMTGFVHADEVCGPDGYGYNSSGNPAGSDLYTIHVIRLDESGSASYYYITAQSYYNVSCSQGLVAGDWFIYAETNESGTHYYSNGFAFYDWEPHESMSREDLRCYNTNPPNIPYPDK